MAILIRRTPEEERQLRVLLGLEAARPVDQPTPPAEPPRTDRRWALWRRRTTG